MKSRVVICSYICSFSTVSKYEGSSSNVVFFVICRASSWSGPADGECNFNTASTPDKFIELKHLNPNCDSEGEALAYSIEVKKNIMK